MGVQYLSWTRTNMKLIFSCLTSLALALPANFQQQQQQALNMGNQAVDQAQSKLQGGADQYALKDAQGNPIDVNKVVNGHQDSFGNAAVGAVEQAKADVEKSLEENKEEIKEIGDKTFGEIGEDARYWARSKIPNIGDKSIQQDLYKAHYNVFNKISGGLNGQAPSGMTDNGDTTGDVRVGDFANFAYQRLGIEQQIDNGLAALNQQLNR